MKGIVKGMIAGIIIIVIGAAILVTALALSDWKVTGVKFETATFTAEGENSALDVKIGAGTLVTEFYDGDKVIIEYPFAKNYNAEISERDGCVYYSSKLKWHIFWFGTPDIPRTVIKLPQSVTFKVNIEVNAGTVSIADGNYSDVKIDMNAGTFKANAVECNTLICDMNAGTVNIAAVTCNSFDCDLDAGTVKVDKINTNAAKIDVSAGSAKLGFTGEQSEYGITAKVSAGSCNAGTQQGSTNKTINVDVSAGSVNLSFNV